MGITLFKAKLTVLLYVAAVMTEQINLYCLLKICFIILSLFYTSTPAAFPRVHQKKKWSPQHDINIDFSHS